MIKVTKKSTIGQNHQAWPPVAASAGASANAGATSTVSENRPMNIIVQRLPFIRIFSS
jgi:hypothetical protein